MTQLDTAAPTSNNATPDNATASTRVKPNILIVDDRRENLIATERVLRRLDAGIHKAASGAEALALIDQHRFAIVLLDVQMPEMDGFETARRMQQIESMKNTPIIFVTAISKDEAYTTQAAEIGAVDYIFKPINSDILRSKVKVFLDIYTQREEILRLNDILRHSNEELERFAYICSHDMQEPARMMACYAELVNEDYADNLDAEGKKYLSFITDNAKHMQQMIVDILDFARVGREQPRLEPVDCASIADDVLAEFKTEIAAKKAHVTVGALPRIVGSQTMVHILLQNLIGNALKFQNGARAPEIAIAATREGSLWRFSVSDNGIGIDPAFSDRVFAVFQRIHRRQDYPGTGIGLSTCKKFVELYGGQIWYESTIGVGTIFNFTIPADISAIN